MTNKDKAKLQYWKMCIVTFGKRPTPVYKKMIKELTFGMWPLDETWEKIYKEFLWIHYDKEKLMYSEVFRDIGIATSISQAKGAGWFKPIPEGWNSMRLDGMKEYKKNAEWTPGHWIVTFKKICASAEK